MNASARGVEVLVRPIAARAAEGEGAELVDLEFRREPAGWVLRLFIDKAGGVSLDDCRRVSELVGTLLEVEDPIPHAYTLEVSSPGLTRPLGSAADWRRAVGRLIRIVTRTPVSGRQALVGRLLEAGTESVLIDSDGAAIQIPNEVIARARLEVEWPQPADTPGGGRSRAGRRGGRGRAGDGN